MATNVVTEGLEFQFSRSCALFCSGFWAGLRFVLGSELVLIFYWSGFWSFVNIQALFKALHNKIYRKIKQLWTAGTLIPKPRPDQNPN
jgi:hypothetical protein